MTDEEKDSKRQRDWSDVKYLGIEYCYIKLVVLGLILYNYQLEIWLKAKYCVCVCVLCMYACLAY